MNSSTSCAFSAAAAAPAPVRVIRRPPRKLWVSDLQAASTVPAATCGGAVEQEADAPPAAAVGLSISHISPLGSDEPSKANKLSVSVAIGGSLVKLNGYQRERVGGGRRGLIGGFSAASRKRLMLLLASINQALCGLPLFVTLTYPASWPNDPKVWKRHLDTFSKRLLRECPKASAVWKLERQKRGAPHYHLLLFGVPFLDRLWLSRVWYEVVASGDPKHLVAGTQVERVRSWRGVMSYAAKYLGKVGVEFEDGEVGRYWGVIGRSSLPIDVMTLPASDRVWLAMRRVAWKYLQKRRVKVHQTTRGGVTLFIGSAIGLRLLALFGGDDGT